MAATNFTPIQLYFSTTASAVPLAANLAQGELAINITDGKLYYEDNAGAVQVIATKGAGTIGGSTTQIQYNNAGALAGNAAMVFNNSTNVTTLTTLNLTNALGAIYGGTAQSTYAQGDFLYASAANTLSKLGIGTVNYILTSTGTVPQWVAPSSIAVLTATNLAGGLGGSVPYQSAVDTTTFLAIGAANRVMTSSGTAPQWVTALTGLTGLSTSSFTNTSLTTTRVRYSTTGGLETDSANLTFDGTTLSTAGLSNTGVSTLVKTLTLGNSNFSGTAVFAAATPAKLYIGTGTVTDVTSAASATNTTGAIASLGITPIAATNTGVTYTNASTLYIAGAPSAGTNVTITNPYSLYINAGAAYLGGTVTLNGGTANGVAYLNGSKVLTTGSALTFDGSQLFTSGTLAITGGGASYGINLIPSDVAQGGKLHLSTGQTTNTSARNWALINSYANYGDLVLRVSNVLGGDPSTGGTTVFSATSSTIAFSPSGTEGMRLTSTGLGIGTSSPTQKLSIQGATFVSSSFNGQSIGDVSAERIRIGYKNGTPDTGLVPAQIIADTVLLQFASRDNVSGTITFATGTGIPERMRIDSSGNVGIGTTSPSVKLQSTTATASASIDTNSTMLGIGGTADTTGALRLIGFGFKLNTFYPAYIGAIQTSGAGNTFSDLGFYTRSVTTDTAPTERARIDSSGNLGIGTTTPGSFEGTVKTVIGGGSGSPILTLYGGNATYSGIYFADGTTGNEKYRGFFEYDHASDALRIGTIGSTRATLDSSGNLGIGVTPSAWNTFKPISVGDTGSSIAGTANQILLTTNAYYSTGFIYSTTNVAAYYQQTTGEHRWYNAPSGTAGTAITFTQAMTLTAAGNLGLGITSADARLRVVGAGTNPGAIRIGYNGTSVNYIDADTNIFRTGAAAETMRIDSSGNLTVSTGNIIQGTAAKGINFTANTATAGSTSQLLNWYEEGTWTPNQGAGLTVVGAFSSAGRYTRIGRLVTVHLSVSGATTVAGASGGVITSNLPFTASGINPVGSATNNTPNASSSVQGGGTTIYLATAIPASGSIYVTLTYQVAV